MRNEVVARYRNEGKRLEVAVERDADNDLSPLLEEPWMSFPTSSKAGYRYGSIQVEQDELQALARDARAEGGIAIRVSIRAQSHVIFTASEADEGLHACPYGYLIATAEGLKALDRPVESAIAELKKLLERYQDWANGNSWACVVADIDRCNKGEWHQANAERHSGYTGVDYEKTGLLEDAEVQSGKPPRLNEGWKKIKVDG